MKPPIILVADDDKNALKLIETSLKESGFLTEKVNNGEEALDKISSLSPDLVILDVTMPKMDGITVAKKIKADERYRFIPIIMLTARDGVEDKVKGLDAGADDYIT